MSEAEFSLRERDQKRLIKDRLVRFAVSAGGVGVLAALVLIFVYLALMVLPLFGDANITPNVRSATVTTSKPLALAVDDAGGQAFVISAKGKIDFWSLNSSSNNLASQRTSKPIFSQQVSDIDDALFARSLPAYGLYAFASPRGTVKLVKPNFAAATYQQEHKFNPNISTLPIDFDLQTEQSMTGQTKLVKFAFATQQNPTLVGWYSDHSLQIRWQQQGQLHYYRFAKPIEVVDQLLLTPDGNTLYLRSGSELIIMVKQANTFRVREIVDLSQARLKHKVSKVDLLPGAYSLLVTHQDGLVSQWFDVLRNGKRQLTEIRQFKLASELNLLLPDSYRKGFYSFYANGTVQSHYTTSEKLVIFERVYQQAPQLVAMSKSESYIAALSGNQLTLAQIDNPFPEISLSSLWQKVWYEGYPQPEFVWQTSSASEGFEAKFSLVPIAFGTLKAAMFAMMFAIPVAVLGAIYTAYFMTPKMRGVVKPSIELMEALPTVIIGFLAGLWFAPIVESHLAAITALVIVLPLSTLLVGFLWHGLSKPWSGQLSNGWHAAILMPIMALLCAVVLSQSGNIETVLFDGDVRVYLAEKGIDFDQRNALVVGFAMGFAVIPTIFTIAEDAIFSVPKHLSDGSLALGATPWQTLIHVVLLTASPGIFSAIMMGLGRAVGETMIVLMATGNTPIMDWNILEGMRTLSATIAVEMPESAVGSSHYRILFLAALLLLIFTFAVNSLAEWVRERLREKYRSL